MDEMDKYYNAFITILFIVISIFFFYGFGIGLGYLINWIVK